MDLGKILVVAVVLAALVLVGVRAWNREAPDESSSPTDRQASREAGTDGEIARAPAHTGDGAVAGNRSASGSKSDSATGGGAGQRARDAVAEHLGGRPGSAGGAPGVSTGGSGRSRDSTASAGGTSATGSGGGAVSFGSVPGNHRGTGGERTGRRDEIVDLLAAQKPGARPGEDGTQTSGEVGDVVLSVPLDRTTEAEDGTKPIVEENVDVSEEGVGVSFKEGSVVQFPNAGNANGDAGSISFDIAPNWAGSEESSNSFVQIRDPDAWANTLKLGKNGRYLRFILVDSAGVEIDISHAIDSWQPGERQNITVTWGEAETAMYVNGRRVGWNTYANPIVFRNNTPMYLGASSANATIQNFKVYGRRLPPEEID
jgi:hypothetical protein